MPVLAEELLSNVNLKKRNIPCLNEKCDNFFMKDEIKYINEEDKEKNLSTYCEICRNYNLKNNLKYIIIDLRNKNDSQIKDSITNEGTFIFINNDILSQEIKKESNIKSEKDNNILIKENEKKEIKNDNDIIKEEEFKSKEYDEINKENQKRIEQMSKDEKKETKSKL